jgi:COP9 signalosome complex subunit 6
MVGAILGQQNGREITMEVAFESKTVFLPDGCVNLDEEWFTDRLEQCK